MLSGPDEDEESDLALRTSMDNPVLGKVTVSAVTPIGEGTEL